MIRTLQCKSRNFLLRALAINRRLYSSSTLKAEGIELGIFIAKLPISKSQDSTIPICNRFSNIKAAVSIWKL